MEVVLHHGDCLEYMKSLETNSIDSIVTDPPYGLGFMGKAWDDLPPGLPWAQECLRVLKPGGHLLAFGGTRTWHRLASAVEGAGFEIRDSIAWLYGSGFPKSLDVSKAIDKAAGAEREVVGMYASPEGTTGANSRDDDYGFGVGDMSKRTITAPATPDAERWQGWGTALKPAFEPIVVGRKPLAEKTVAANVLAHGTGALNVDGCRVEGGSRPLVVSDRRNGNEVYGDGLQGSRSDGATSLGRWPANVILDESQAEALDEQSGGSQVRLGDSGGASRFFYVAKASKKERPRVEDLSHPTVKPLALMQWLTRLVTPTGGTVLDPFAGSGTTVEACLIEGFSVVAVEKEIDYMPLIHQRLERHGYASAVDKEQEA